MNLSCILRVLSKLPVLLLLGLPLTALAAGSASMKSGYDAAPPHWQKAGGASQGGVSAGPGGSFVLAYGGQAWWLVLPDASRGLQDFDAILSSDQQAANLAQARLGALWLLLDGRLPGTLPGSLRLGDGFGLRPIAAAPMIDDLFGLPARPPWIR